ncbi:MAG: sigma-70 family RNA polymerase sigma factor [Streptosporangiaceae bacterium]
MDDDMELIQRLRAGDEQAFVVLVRRYHESMIGLASSFVPSRAVAEEVVQDTWMGVVRGIGNFEGRSSLRTWLFRILVNRARTAGTRERRSVAIGDAEPAVDPSRFDEAGAWQSPPEQWVEEADDRLRSGKLAGRVRSVIEELPARQREVVTLRDVEGLSSDEVCHVLEITDGNQRVLLHRGRSRVRQVLETEFGRA